MLYVGITPAVTNEVGLYITPDSYDIASLPRNTRVNAHRIKSIRDRRKRRSNNATGIAVPNDRLRSVRPSERDQQYEYVYVVLNTYLNGSICFTSKRGRKSVNQLGLNG